MRYSGYWAGCNNFGDNLTKEIWESMTHKKMHPENIDYAKLCGAGSILNCFTWEKNKKFNKYPLYVFGTGVDGFNVNYDYFFNRELKVYAVRGKYTKKYLEKMTGDKYQQVCLGDIGLLAGYIKPETVVEKKYDLGIVPHYIDKSDSRFKLMEKYNSNSKILSVEATPREFIKEMMECRCIISTAMHPIIVSDALGIPNIWAYLPNANQVDMSFKFNDYYSVFGMEKKPFVLSDNNLKQDIVNIINKEYSMQSDMVNNKVNELEKSFYKMYLDMQSDWTADILWMFKSKMRQFIGIIKQ
jgi:hypothetical protein